MRVNQALAAVASVAGLGTSMTDPVTVRSGSSF
jgi:hypothetical protein